MVVQKEKQSLSSTTPCFLFKDLIQKETSSQEFKQPTHQAIFDRIAAYKKKILSLEPEPIGDQIGSKARMDPLVFEFAQKHDKQLDEFKEQTLASINDLEKELLRVPRENLASWCWKLDSALLRQGVARAYIKANQQADNEWLEDRLYSTITEKFAEEYRALGAELTSCLPLNIPDLREQKKDLAINLLDQIFGDLDAQTKHKPERFYTPHGAKHSFAVAYYHMDNLFDSVPPLRESMERVYGPKWRTVAHIAGLLHDIGYANNGSEKDAHAAKSAEVVQEKYLAYLRDVVGLNELQITSFVEAIRLHNADKEGRVPYKEASIKHDPLLFALRVADNADLVCTRLDPIQRTPEFVKLLEILYKDKRIERLYKDYHRLEKLGMTEEERLRFRKEHHALQEEVKDKYLTSLKGGISDEMLKDLWLASRRVNGFDFLHILGIVSTIEVKFRYSEEKGIAMIVFTDANAKKYGKHYNGEYIFDYQAHRVRESFKSLILNDENPTIEIIPVTAKPDPLDENGIPQITVKKSPYVGNPGAWIGSSLPPKL